jgi:hypothetical protein
MPLQQSKLPGVILSAAPASFALRSRRTPIAVSSNRPKGSQITSPRPLPRYNFRLLRSQSWIGLDYYLDNGRPRRIVITSGAMGSAVARDGKQIPRFARDDNNRSWRDPERFQTSGTRW